MKTTDFEIYVGRKTHKCRTLRECQRKLIEYREDGQKGASRFLVNDGRVCRNGVKVGTFSYNGRFWRNEV